VIYINTDIFFLKRHEWLDIFVYIYQSGIVNVHLCFGFDSLIDAKYQSIEM